jgi:membrane protease YdiL (CAAX protease family)
MNTTALPYSKRNLTMALLRFIGLLVLAQGIRALLTWLLIGVIGLENQVAQPIALAVMAGIIWLVVRPTWQDLGLDLRRGTEKTTWWLYGAMAAIILMLLAANFMMDRSLGLLNLYGVILTPIIEEALFRGLGWGSLSKALPQKWNNIITWVVISLLFGLWHLGYADVIHWWSDKPIGLAGLPTVMIWKVLIGGFIGGAAGLARWKWKKLPGAVFVHAMFNIFGR